MTEAAHISTSTDTLGGGPPAGVDAAPVRLWVDTHVHLYPRFDVATFLDAAKSSLAGAFADGSSASGGCLMLTETARDDGFRRLQSEGSFGDWSVSACADGLSLKASCGDAALFVIAGRQVVTQERLEVLALGTRAEIADGQPIDATIEQALAADALPVLPYALGKWTGARGKRIAEAVNQWAGKGVCVGDNACRPWGLPTPSVFKLARNRNVPVLPGSDPLNIPGGEWCAGRYGVVIEAEINPDAPGAGVVQALRDPSAHAGTFGGRVSPVRCVLQQVALRRHKRGQPQP